MSRQRSSRSGITQSPRQAPPRMDQGGHWGAGFFAHAGQSPNARFSAPPPGRVPSGRGRGKGGSTTIHPARGTGERHHRRIARCPGARGLGCAAAPPSRARRGSSRAVPLPIGLAEVSIDAEPGGAVAMLLAGARGDHDHRQVAQPRLLRRPTSSKPSMRGISMSRMTRSGTS